MGRRGDRVPEGQLSGHEARRRSLRRGRRCGRVAQDRARPDARAPEPEGNPGVRQPGADRRCARGRREAGEGQGRGARAVLPWAGPAARARRRAERRLHVEPRAGRRGVRHARHDAREGAAGQGRHDDSGARRRASGRPQPDREPARRAERENRRRSREAGVVSGKHAGATRRAMKSFDSPEVSWQSEPERSDDVCPFP
ncbi:hypothetical protein EMIT0111MI5_90243 [Burkholderia sp. IT-111MI5]